MLQSQVENMPKLQEQKREYVKQIFNECLNKQLSDLQNSLQNYVTKDEYTELISDIQTSINFLLSMTPRDGSSALQTQIDQLNNRLTELEKKYNDLQCEIDEIIQPVSVKDVKEDKKETKNIKMNKLNLKIEKK